MANQDADRLFLAHQALQHLVCDNGLLVFESVLQPHVTNVLEGGSAKLKLSVSLGNQLAQLLLHVSGERLRALSLPLLQFMNASQLLVGDGVPAD